MNSLTVFHTMAASSSSSLTPQAKKYLCHAPRPEQWDEVAPDVLEKLPNAEANVKRALKRLQKYMDPPKRGPGRKSNGEHALAFYEFLLDEAKKYPSIQGTESSEDEDEPDSDEEKHEKSEEEPEVKAECQVCRGTKALSSCSTCKRQFHKDCVKPSYKCPKPWQCPFCLIKKEPKHTKLRRQAAVALRLMARIKNKLRRERGTGDSIGSDEESGKKNEETDRQETPSKRQRKQPLLYNPQGSTPASQWVSDETPSKQAKKKYSSDEDSSSNESDVSEDMEQEGRGESSDEPMCVFCHDDDEIPVCVFCACRVCFGKHNHHKLLLCDQCDDEYHMTCLDPPLKKVPRDGKPWYCPSCTSAKDREAGRKEAKRRREEEAQRTRSGRSITPTDKSIPPENRKRDRSLSGSPPRKHARLSTPVTVSRSGRTVKRGAFHDEIDEGEQHLRVTTSSGGSQRSLSKSKSGSSLSPAAATPRSSHNLSQNDPSAGRIVQSGSTTTDRFMTSAINSSNETISTLQTTSTKPTEEKPQDSASLQPGLIDLAGNDDNRSSIAASGLNSSNTSLTGEADTQTPTVKVPRRKPGARECMQISRRFGNDVIPEKYMNILLDYCQRGKVEHLIRMRERLDEHSLYLQSQLFGLEARVKEVGESDMVVPPQEENEVVEQKPASTETATTNVESSATLNKD